MLTNREIISKRKIRIFLDSNYLSRLLSDDNSQARAFLDFLGNPLLEFLRTQNETEHIELKEIPEVILRYDENDELRGLEIKKSDTIARSLYFGYSFETILQIGEYLFDGKEIDEHKLEDLLLVFIQATLQNLDPTPIFSDETTDTGIFVTDKKILLKNRYWFEGHFPGGILNIVTFDEAIEIIDLFFKFRSQYYLLSNYQFDKGLYYLCSFRSKIPYFHFSRDHFDAFARRFNFLLMSLDEIGFQYFSGTGNNAMDNLIYHFNYFITLTTGIFDSLAIRANDQYELGFKLGSMISLNSNSGDKFLRALRDKNQDLRDHISSNSQFIKLIYQLREEVVHRQMLKQMGFSYKGEDGEWKSNFIKTSDDVKQRIKQCKDNKVKYQVVSNWGVYEFAGDCFLEPYSFSKAATRELINFSDNYLQIMGSSNFISDSKSNGEHSQFVKELELFKKFKLGF